MLETKIDALTKAIEALTLAMQSTKQEIKDLSEQTIEPTVEPVTDWAKDEEMIDQVPAQVIEKLNHTDLRDIILKANRIDASNKPIMRELLTKYGANKVTEVSVADIPSMMYDIEKVIA